MSRPYLYHYVDTFSRSHKLSQAITRKELDKLGFKVSSPATAWEHFGVNADTLVVVTNVPLTSSKTYVHVVATSNTDAPAKNWAAATMKALKKSKLVLID